VLSQGALWGVAVWLFWGLGTPYHRVVLILIVYSYCLGSVQLLATQRKVFLAFISLVLVPTIVRIASDTSQPWHLQLAFILTLLFFLTVLMARTYGSALGQAIALKRRTDELARLRQQMRWPRSPPSGRRGPPRRRGRQPRQDPVLRRRQPRPAPAAARHGPVRRGAAPAQPRPRGGLAGQQHQRERRRAGGPVRRAARHHAHRHRRRRREPAPVRLRELFARLRLHFEPTAFEKGLMLASAASSTWRMADPVLLERVLRNLVSNAIRYTDDGGVLVSCGCAAAAVRCRCCWCRCGTAASASPSQACRASSTSSTRCRARARWRRTSARAWAWGWPSSSGWPG
jgi:two-component system, sensor histidine kinase